VTGPSSYKKRIYRAEVSQRLRNTVLNLMCLIIFKLTELNIIDIQDKI